MGQNLFSVWFNFSICVTFQAIACAVQFDDQHVGIYASDGDT